MRHSTHAVLRDHPLATLTGLGLVLIFLLRDGAMCPKCGHGTRATSQRWARCKKCGERVQRMPNAAREGRRTNEV